MSAHAARRKARHAFYGNEGTIPHHAQVFGNGHGIQYTVYRVRAFISRDPAHVRKQLLVPLFKSGTSATSNMNMLNVEDIKSYHGVTRERR